MKRHKRGFEETLEQHGLEYDDPPVQLDSSKTGGVYRRLKRDKPLNLIRDDEEEEE